MNSHFAPDSYQRKDRRSRTSEKSEVHDSPMKNQPRVKIWTVTLFQPKPKDKINHYFVSMDKPLELQPIADRMASLYGMDAWLYGGFLNFFEVLLENPIEFSVIERVTLQVLSEFDA